jgi:solute carrier family 25, member 38
VSGACWKSRNPLRAPFPQGPTVARVFVGAGVYFLVLHELMGMVRTAHGLEEGAPLPTAWTFAVGAAARCLAAGLLNPVSLAKTRMEWAKKDGSPYRGTLSAVVSIARQEGVRGLFAGLVPTMIRDAPYSGIYLSVFMRAKRAVAPGGSLEALGAPFPEAVRTFVCGLLGGVVATLVVHPADTIKTRLQLRSASFLGSPLDPKPTIVGEIRAVFREGGVRTLFAGAVARVTKRTLSTALTWTLFEQVLKVTRPPHGGG